MSHSSHSTQNPVQGSTGAQQPRGAAAASGSGGPASAHPRHGPSGSQVAAPGETDNIPPRAGDADEIVHDWDQSAASSASASGVNAQAEDLERGVQHGSDNTMNDEGGVAPGAATSGVQGADADMQFGSHNSSLPPIDDPRRQQMDKAAQRAARDAQECASFKTMTFDQKKKALDAYIPQNNFTKGCYIDAQDTTNIFIMAKIVTETTNDVNVNFDGWSEKWNEAFRKKSHKIAPFRSQAQGYSGQNYVAIRNSAEPFTLSEVRFHIVTLESYIMNDFEGKTAHQLTQYVRGHLFVFLDQLMGETYKNGDIDEEEWRASKGQQHPFEHSEVQRLFRTYLRFATAYFRKLTTVGKSMSEVTQLPGLFLVDPECALVSCYYEVAETLACIFAAKGRTLKHYIRSDASQLPVERISAFVEQSGDRVIANTFGAVVKDFTKVDFVSRSTPNADYNVEQVFYRVQAKQDLIFGTLCNYVQYFAEIGGFDALMTLLKMGVTSSQSEESKQDEVKGSSAKDSPKLPFSIMSQLTQSFTHLNEVLTEEFSRSFTATVKQVILSRLETMTEKDLKDIDKDEIAALIAHMRDFLAISFTRQESAEFVEHTTLTTALRFLKSENLEKRLKGLAEIRAMCERVIERSRFESYRTRTGKNLSHWNTLEQNKSKPYPSEVIKLPELKQWIIKNKVLQTIMGPNAHIEIVKRCGPLLKLLCRQNEVLFDEGIVELIWRCQAGKHEEMVRTIYNLIQEVLPALPLPIIDSFFQKMQDMPPAQIDEKYVVFIREFTKIALNKRFEHAFASFPSPDKQESQIPFYTSVRDKERSNIAALTSQNASQLAAQLQGETHDYGLRLFWQICQDNESGQANLSAEIQELVIASVIEIFQDTNNVKQVRSLYLIKAVANILALRSMHQSITIAQKIICSVQADPEYRQLDENEDKEVSLVLELQKQVKLTDAVVYSLAHYQEGVKQRVKQLYQSGATLPDKIDEQVFQGRYTHQQTLQTILDFAEFMIVQAQRDNQSQDYAMTSALGIENIKRLWCLFVKDPNFQSDQTLFLDWINKQRTLKYYRYNQNYQKVARSHELSIFTEQEKQFLFEHFLCNPEEVDASSISVALVKVFQKYFRLINIAKQHLQPERTNKSKFKVISFDQLLGMDALWKMSLFSQNEKAKDLSQQLLVNLHLRFDNATATREHKQAVIGAFVKHCMSILTSDGAFSGQAATGQQQISTGSSGQASTYTQKAVISLLSLFLDSYEGVKELKPEQSSMARMTNIKAADFEIVNQFDPEHKTSQKVSVSYFQTIGHLRVKIAQEFKLAINEFNILLKSNMIDPDIDDDKYIRDINQLPKKFSIERNTSYDPALHPKYLLAKNQENFQVIFSMLQAGSPELSEPVWSLISKLPVNETVVESLKTLQFIKSVSQQASPSAGAAAAAAVAGGPSPVQAAWKSLLDPQAIYKLLYCLQIMQTEFINVSLPSRDDELYDDVMNAESNQMIVQMLVAYEQQRVWKQEFIALGGFVHLLNCLIELNVADIRSNLELLVIKSLVQVIFKFVNHAREMQQLEQQEKQSAAAGTDGGSAPKLAALVSLLAKQPEQLRSGCILRAISLIDAICKYSIEQEKARGESIEAIQKKIENARQRKQRQRALAQGNKAEKSKQVDDEDDGDSDDKKQLISIMQAFREQANILTHLFDFVDEVFTVKIVEPLTILKYTGLAEMLQRGMIESENQILRDTMCKRISNILKLLHVQGVQQPTSPDAQAQQNPWLFTFGKILEIVLSNLIETTKDPQYESRCSNFYFQLSSVIVLLTYGDLERLQSQVIHLIQQLPRDIIERPIKEIGTSDHDLLLCGLMSVLTHLLQRFPTFKKQVGEVLTTYLIHDCLFEIPHGQKNAPKCKSSTNRRQAFSLLQTMSTDCLENLLIILDYMKKFNENPSWRTNKTSDWAIRLYEDEKSTTGRVGIKNLGCICYMNSLNQQLFMIPGFRNDILSVDDPNHDENPDEDNMFLQWQTLFAGLLLSQKMYVNPKSYCHAFKDWEGQPVNVFEQMDVEEYLTMFMDRLEAAIKGTPQEKTIQYHFGGKFANEVICKTCPHIYTRDEAFLSLGVPVKNKKTLQEGMEAFIAGDLLEQDNQYHCEKCDKKVDALKRTCLKEMPRYLITTLKRFDFDFDLMIRKKLNDYFEFQTEVDFREYTQEYLNQKEKLEKDREEKKKNQSGEADDDEQAALDEIKLTNPAEYYQYDLVGIIVHTGTADSGHYYSYIKEQDEFRIAQDQGKAGWYEFNDIYVRDFEPVEIPTETFGGEENAYGQGVGQQVPMRMRNAYVLVYKRKLTDESLIVTDDDASSTVPNEGNNAAAASTDGAVVPKYKLGSQQLQLDGDNKLNQKIQWDNHRYWHIRYLFRPDYRIFATNVLLYWNTQYIIPREVSWRNDDYHLLDPAFANLVASKSASLMEIEDTADVSLDLRQSSTPEAIQDAKLRVFKFAVQFYYTIQQRSQQKFGLPDMSRYLKAYINEDVRCARWFISEFINCELLQEIMMQNSQKLMRRVYIGIITCAMLKLYEVEKAQLNLYWDDVEQGVEPPRQTTLGNYINTLLFLLPKLKNFSANQAQFLQVLNQFSRTGLEAKQYLIRAGAIQRLLNFFYFTNTPFREAFIDAPRLPGDFTELPYMGLPTPEDPNQKKSTLAIIKERERLHQLNTDTPPYMHLIECISNLIRCIHVPVPQGVEIPAGQPATMYQIADLGVELSQDNLVLFTPDVSFIIQIFAAAHRPRAAVALSKAYVHYSYYDRSAIKRLCAVVFTGIKEYDHEKTKPFLILLQHMIETAQSGHALFVKEIFQRGNLEQFFTQVVATQRPFYQVMEVLIDWIIKVGMRVPLMREWMQANAQVWTFLIDWLKDNPNPPVQQQYARSNVHLNKSEQEKRGGLYRFNLRRNQALCFYRKHCLIQLKSGQQVPDLSAEIDLDYYHLDEFKLRRDQKVFVCEDPHMYQFMRATVVTEMDELVYIRFARLTRDERFEEKWEATDRGRIMIEGVWETSYMCRKLTRFEELFRKQEIGKVQGSSGGDAVNASGQDDEMSDGNNTDEAQGERSLPRAYYQGDEEPEVGGQPNGQEGNEDMIDQTEQDEFIV